MGVAEDLAALEARLRAVEDERAIGRLILSYGPAADAGLAEVAASVWREDGVYDWDANGAPHEGRAAVAAMLRTDGHQGLVRAGVAHVAGPPLVDVDGDTATAITYSLIMRRDSADGRYYLWRVSAARWDLTREDGGWAVRRRTNRLLDDTGAGRDLLAGTVRELLGAIAR
ncbi:nuclear transport factor 2 family protein [Frankia sp. AgB1.9]|uniref:nuclear transport factor 2 family protein n=1 Tax=unclassified Frankia TaxID=2632575 RepID=UPI001934AFDE|nr:MULTISPECIES: nuclear transport factor 2 family protein [unclassified Frankia]MBL7487550.1 nuclear transport factor 2 family protein [Frankia sp. AgW1.1]MBL7549521.1 nuclear transport factor 2 family protein [Frankia sp. AgB1.9]MBL7620690.1 nuclear transport factor 2 family protein [Frankia sp. AgB1.8]